VVGRECRSAGVCLEVVLRDRAATSPGYTARRSIIAGFMTGAGTMPGMSGGRLSNTDADAITRAIETYCKGHPLDTVASPSAENRRKNSRSSPSRSQESPMSVLWVMKDHDAPMVISDHAKVRMAGCHQGVQR
jgi:hypothetical protein